MNSEERILMPAISPLGEALSVQFGWANFNWPWAYAFWDYGEGMANPASTVTVNYERSVELCGCVENKLLSRKMQPRSNNAAFFDETKETLCK
jgi:hypothetical protein